eukprot:COSAG06_NODE_63578_length_262_cov_0.564417_1_plen_40_part_10
MTTLAELQQEIGIAFKQEKLLLLFFNDTATTEIYTGEDTL